MSTAIHLVSSDLSHQETILQIIDALDHLDKVTDNIFGSIQSKINENATKLNNLDQRIQVADEKVKRLAGMNQKATCIFSSAKYPDQVDRDFTSALSGLDLNYVPNKDVFMKKFPEANVKGLDSRDVGEKRRYFHLPVKRKPTTSQRLEENPDLRMPSSDIKSALSYLIFNTAENPYANKSSSDLYANPLEGTQKSKKPEDLGENPGRLGDAPSSFAQDHDVDSTVDLFFAPALGDLPDLDLPDILDLPNLPTDLSYSTDLGPGIAPSIQSLLPDLSDLSIPEDTEVLLSSAPTPPPASAIPPPPLAEMMTAIPPPPPLPPGGFIPDLPPPSMAEFQALSSIPVSNSRIADEHSDSSSDLETAKDKPDAPKIPTTGDGRASLMEAIRNAGGRSKAGLKSVKDQKLEEKKAKLEEEDIASSRQPAGGGGGDLMSDLANKLAMRRKGISGAQQNQNFASGSSSGGALGKMSMMIPSLVEDPDGAVHDDYDESSDDDWS